MADSEYEELRQHLEYLDIDGEQGEFNRHAGDTEIDVAPFFSLSVRREVDRGSTRSDDEGRDVTTSFPQYGLLGLRQATYGAKNPNKTPTDIEPNIVYANMNAPWSAFICGSQGAGKSHSLSCLLENSLLSPSPVSKLPRPLAGIIFHHDRFSSMATTQLCEAAYLCSSGIPVRVLVSPSNFSPMERLYSNLPGLSKTAKKPYVARMYFKEQHLNSSNILALMSVDDSSGSKPLYLESLCRILREMATDHPERSGIDYRKFKHKLLGTNFSKDQQSPLNLRLQLLEAFLEQKAAQSSTDVWKCEPGSLTIVDLSDPFVSAGDACALFSICLSLFMEQRADTGRVIAVDEAHKFLTQSGSALELTEKLESIIRQQQHLATRVFISTQEPTLAPSLLDLCDVTIVHRFRSPAWYEVLKKHLSGARLVMDGGIGGTAGKEREKDIFRTIVGLRRGEALVFCPSAILDIEPTGEDVQDDEPAGRANSHTSIQKLDDSYIRLRIRSRITEDGGKSIMAT